MGGVLRVGATVHWRCELLYRRQFSSPPPAASVTTTLYNWPVGFFPPAFSLSLGKYSARRYLPPSLINSSAQISPPSSPPLPFLTHCPLPIAHCPLTFDSIFRLAAISIELVKRAKCD